MESRQRQGLVWGWMWEECKGNQGALCNSQGWPTSGQSGRYLGEVNWRQLRLLSASALSQRFEDYYLDVVMPLLFPNLTPYTLVPQNASAEDTVS